MAGVSFIHTTHNDITLIAATKNNVNCALILHFLHGFIQLCKAYIGGEINENSIRQNFSLIYELLDEVMDYGYPQILDADLLKEYIRTGKQITSLSDIEKLKQITVRATGAISWRAEGIKYRRNEVFIDIIESVNVLLSNRGTVLKADVYGRVSVKTQLSGMPECKFGVNDKLVMRNTGTTSGTNAIEPKKNLNDKGI
jgi:AP-2 complex subunit mu-1